MFMPKETLIKSVFPQNKASACDLINMFRSGGCLKIRAVFTVQDA